MDSSVKDIRRAQRESLLLGQVSSFFLEITRDDKELEGLYIVRVRLSPDQSKLTVFVHTFGGLEAFEAKRPTLVLYVPSLRSALAKCIPSRRVPNIMFKFDAQREKVERINLLLQEIDPGNE